MKRFNNLAARTTHFVSVISVSEMIRTALLILVTCTGAAVNATVCVQTQINSNTKICCGSLPHARFIGGHEFGCFQDKVFNKTEKVACGDGLELRTSVEEIYTKDFICCLGQFHIKENDDGCCRGDKERLYKRRLQECCNGVVVDRKVDTAQVCRGTELVDRNAGIHRLRQCTGPNGQETEYDPSSYVCCTQTGLIKATPGPGQYFCHDDGIYNSYIMQLIRLKNGCNVVVQQGIKLCGSAFITTQSTFYDTYCCDGVVHQLEKSEWNTMECCGTKMYNYTSQTCCNNTILNGDQGCCLGYTPYILKAEECCENKVINRSKELCCKNNIVTKTHPSHYGCCNINRAWKTYNGTPEECLLTGETTERSPLEDCPFTECFDREQKQRSHCRKCFELDLYLDAVNFTDDGSNLDVTIIQPDEFVNKKVSIFVPYICPCLDSGHVYTLFTNRGWVRNLTIDGHVEFTNLQTIKKNDFLVKRGSGADKFTCTIRRKHSSFYSSWRVSPVPLK